MKIIKLPFYPKRWAMCFLGVIWCGDKSWITPYVINHENIHLKQQQEMLFLFFYIAYVIEWLFRCIQYRSFHKGYLNISHEREAYRNDHNLNYLKERKHFEAYRTHFIQQRQRDI